MHKILVCAIVVYLAVLGVVVFAADAENHPKHEGSTDLQRIKALAGTWQGKMTM